MENNINSEINTAERIHMILDKSIVRYNHPEGWRKSNFFCVDFNEAIVEIMKSYPELSAELIWGVIAKHLTILKGTLTDFIGGTSKMARELSILISEQKLK